jgi:hypothetical protein
MEREVPHEAMHLRSRIAANRRSLRAYGYVVSCGLWNPYINGISVPLWSPQYRDFMVLTLGLLAAMYDEKRLRTEVAPQMLALAQAIADLPDSVEGNPFVGPNGGLIVVSAEAGKVENKKPAMEDMHELEARTRRTRTPPSLRARDGRRGQG